MIGSATLFSSTTAGECQKVGCVTLADAKSSDKFNVEHSSEAPGGHYVRVKVKVLGYPGYREEVIEEGG